MAEIRKIGIITSGGDCGGLMRYSLELHVLHSIQDWICLIPNGYAGLYNLKDIVLDNFDWIRSDKFFRVLPGQKQDILV